MERFEIQLATTVYVEVEFGGEAEARAAVRDVVANDWLLRVAEGTRLGAGHFLVKGVSTEVRKARPPVENPKFMTSGKGGRDR